MIFVVKLKVVMVDKFELKLVPGMLAVLVKVSNMYFMW